ncbi:MAG: glycerate kinase, partial [Kiritimatiellae bacterium]|nr:glycerate kinase [Kiritimatiellia bacterium]
MTATQPHPLRIAVAPDSFKGTLTSAQAAAAIVGGFRRVLPPDTVYDCIPMADGGEGTVDAWLSATGAERVECDTEDPL